MQRLVDDTVKSWELGTPRVCAVPAHVHTHVLAAVLAFSLPPLAHGTTRYVADTGADTPGCGRDSTTACRSISQAIELAVAGDRILVGPGRYGDLNRNGLLGEPGEERGFLGAPICNCVLAVNKALVIVSSAGAAVTMIDGRSVDTLNTVFVNTGVGGEFGRPGKGFTVTETAKTGGLPIAGIKVYESAHVMVRGNQVIFTRSNGGFDRTGISPIDAEAILIEGNQVMNWYVGITGSAFGNETVSKNQVMYNTVGIDASGNANVVGNVVTANIEDGISLVNSTTVRRNAAYMNKNGFRPGGHFSIGGQFSGVLTNNNMSANDCGLFNYGVVGLDATNNYWGTATGPSAPPADPVCDESGGTTTTSPFATRPFKVEILKP